MDKSGCLINNTPEGVNDNDIRETNFKCLLNDWGVANDTTNYLWSLKIDIAVLKKFQSIDIDKVFPDLENYGEKIHFRDGLQKWRKEIGTPIIDLSSQKSDTIENTSSSESFLLNWIENTAILSPRSGDALGSHTDLKSILNLSWRGKAVSLFIGQSKVLKDTEQKDICHAITEFYIGNRRKLSLHDMAVFAKEITILFPAEKSETYYVPRQKGKRNPTGKLYDMYNNRQFRIRKQENKAQTTAICPSSSCSELEADDDSDNLEEVRLWLQHNFEPWSEILLKWKNSTKYRYTQIKNSSIDVILKQWPLYNCSEGYHLIDIDFDFLYKDKGNLLIQNYKDFNLKISKFYEENKEKLNQQLYESFRNCDNEGSKNCIASLLLNSLLKPPRISQTIKPTVLDAEEDFLIHAVCVNNVQLCIEKIQNYCLQNHLTMQPKIIAVGSSLNNLEQFLIYFNGVKYVVPTFIRALDITIKICFVFNLKYSDTSKLVWMFIQEYFFKIPSEIIYPSIKNLLNQLENLN